MIMKANNLPPRPALYAFSPQEEAFLDDLEKRIVMYFWNEVYPETGIAIDHTENRVGKVAATGFELAAICIGIEREWIPRDEGYQRVLKILNMFYDDPDDPDDHAVDGQFGLWWHFIDGKTGRMKPIDCVALCDSADLIAGALVVGEYFAGTPAGELARKIVNHVQWDQFVLKTKDGTPDILSFGWVPLHTSEGPYYEIDGLLPFGMNWLTDNSLLIYAIALGSPTHPIPQETWEAYKRERRLESYENFRCTAASSLFVRQVPHAFIRFSRKHDDLIDYFHDTVQALLADRAFNVKANEYPDTLWGLNDCFGKDSYTHSAPPGPIMNDGTIATTSFAGALPHIPKLSLQAMQYAYTNFQSQVWGEYGFTSSLNLKNGFFSPFYVGIELGPMLLLIENARSGMIWDLFMKTETINNFIRRAGMYGIVDDFELAREAPQYAEWTLDSGTLQRIPSEDAPSGEHILSLLPEKDSFQLTARLPQNDLLDFHFGKVLSLQVRGFTPTGVRIIINETMYPLKLLHEDIADTEWTRFSYQLPETVHGEELTGITLSGERTNRQQPALDAVLLKAE
jgi:hypothetical protein